MFQGPGRIDSDYSLFRLYRTYTYCVWMVYSRSISIVFTENGAQVMGSDITPEIPGCPTRAVVAFSKQILNNVDLSGFLGRNICIRPSYS